MQVCRKQQPWDIQSRAAQAIKEVFDLPEGAVFQSHGVYKDPSGFDDWYGFWVEFTPPEGYCCQATANGIHETFL